ncbi:Crp/Fnr family transcriptional regulator [Candidatus Thiothrix sp. Deng01]|uniref:Crp/Fnr family transcriptional regulator n=2 Tax=Thiothrix TaxID=1030 RepID=A0A7L6ARC2_9GAMM|nr:Crp/Fnr family transcriptional regulator [Candidatus Thiothrix sp. Deng01]MEB4589629.1 Crp/Fnr family transcriptional regulator [Candidatus Thiothrix sp. Deng01]QLQ31593.1 MAG: Crp/Fnr family transcriptional regulator [Candidatus Thiothrix singaporensis]
MSNIKGRGHCQTCQIRHLSIFAQLPVNRLAEIQGFQPSVVTYAVDETVYHQGDVSATAFTLRKGLVKLIKTLPNGRTQIVRVLRTGDLFGFDGFAGESYNHTAIPLSDIEVCRLPLGELMELKKQNPEIENTMMRRWIQHLREAEDMMLELGAKKAAERLASFLIRWCENSNGGWSPLPLSRGEIGELLGLTIETVSRFLSDWKRQGFINEQRGSIQIEDIAGLRKAACSSGSC